MGVNEQYRNHNLLGGLQFVAKALEIWFELIAAALVYIVTMLLAGRKEGLPVGYLTRPSEFAVSMEEQSVSESNNLLTMTGYARPV